MPPERPKVETRLARLKVAVTGQRGFIGRYMIAALQSLNVTPVCIEDDVRSPGSWTEAFDLLFHLAAAMPQRFGPDPGEGFSVNVGGTLSALEACRVRGARMVFTSTCGVYDPSVGGAISEECPVAPATPYAQSKLMAEMLCRSYADHFGVSSTVLRLFNVYGAGQNPTFLIPYLVRCALEGREAVVHHPESSRDFVHAGDVAQALMCAAFHEGSFETFNIGMGQPHTVREVLETIGQVIGAPVAWEQGEGGPDPHPSVYADIGQAEAHLGWRPAVRLEEGLREVVNAMRSGRHDS